MPSSTRRRTATGPRQPGRRLVAFGASLAMVLPATLSVLSSPARASSTPALYVALYGSDSNPCTKAAPCATIDHAIAQAPSGGTVRVEPGTYDQLVIIEKPITLVGKRAVVDGWGLDPGTPLLGVLYIGGSGGTTAWPNDDEQVEPGSDAIGGNVTVRGFTFEDPNPDQQTYGDDVCLQPVVAGIYDADPTDVISITQDSFVEGDDDPASADDGPIGLDTLYSWAHLTAERDTFQGVWQGVLLEDNGPSVLKANTFADLVTFNYPNTNTYLDSSDDSQCATLASEDGTTPYQAEGVALLADYTSQSTTDQTVDGNRFVDYDGDGVDAGAPYDAATLSSVAIDGNRFDLGGFSGAGAINLAADDGGTVSGVTIAHNSGTVQPPSSTITEDDFGGPSSGGGTISGVSERDNSITN